MLAMRIKDLIHLLFYLAILVCVLIIISNLAVRVVSRSLIYHDIEKIPRAQAALVLGAAVSGGKLSPIFEDRVKAALKLYNAGKVRKILVSGDNGSIYYNEVSPVRDYLIGAGVPAGDIYLDHAGFDTFSSLYRARDIFQVRSLIIVSQSYHLHRAIFIGRVLGIEVYGFPPADDSSTLKENVREVFADVKAVLDLSLRRKPKYLGPVIPITGTSEQ